MPRCVCTYCGIVLVPRHHVAIIGHVKNVPLSCLLVVKYQRDYIYLSPVVSLVMGGNILSAHPVLHNSQSGGPTVRL